jgi:uncharacterized membrane protein YeaQ/YmgE (transglycosylase-associated protein family)
MSDLFWTIFIGFMVGILARILTPGSQGIRGFIFTTLLGIAGAFVASFLGQFFGYYRPGEQAGFIGSIVGAAIVLLIWGWMTRGKAQNKT